MKTANQTLAEIRMLLLENSKIEVKSGPLKISDLIRRGLMTRDMTARELCVKANIPEPTFYRMLKRNDYKFSILTKIFNAMDYNLEIRLTHKL